MSILYTGVDLHKKQFTVYFMNEEKQGYYYKYLTTAEGYSAFIDTLGKAKGYAADGVEIAVESTGNTRFFINQLQNHGYPVKVVNTMRFKIVNESANKTDKHDARTIAEFLSKDMLPEVKLRSESGEQLRRLLNSRDILVRTNVKLKNQIHGILLGIGIDSKNGQLNTVKGRANVVDSIDDESTRKLVELIINSIENTLDSIDTIENEIRTMVEKNKNIKLLMTIPGTGYITAANVCAQIDDIKRFSNFSKLSAYAGLVPWVQCSDEKKYYGGITKRGPSELRTALIQMVLGMIRCKSETNNRYMNSYRSMKRIKGSGRALVATARKFTKMIWNMLVNETEYDPKKASAYYKLLDRDENNQEGIAIPA